MQCLIKEEEKTQRRPGEDVSEIRVMYSQVDKCLESPDVCEGVKGKGKE